MNDPCPCCGKTNFSSERSLQRHIRDCSLKSGPPRKSSRRTVNPDPIQPVFQDGAAADVPKILLPEMWRVVMDDSGSIYFFDKSSPPNVQWVSPAIDLMSPLVHWCEVRKSSCNDPLPPWWRPRPPGPPLPPINPPGNPPAPGPGPPGPPGPGAGGGGGGAGGPGGPGGPPVGPQPGPAGGPILGCDGPPVRTADPDPFPQDSQRKRNERTRILSRKLLSLYLARTLCISALS